MAVVHEEQNNQKYFEDFDRDVQKGLKGYPHIKGVLSRLDKATLKERYNHPLYAMVGVENQPSTNPSVSVELGRLEETLWLLKSSKHIGEEKYVKIVNKLGSLDISDILGTWAELIVIHECSFLPKLKRICLENQTDSGVSPDVVVECEGEQFYLEVTTLIDSKIQEAIEFTLEKFAEWLFPCLPKNTLVMLHIDTTKLIWTKEGPLDVENSLKHLINSAKSVKLPWLISRFEDVWFSDVGLTGTEPLIENVEVFRHYRSTFVNELYQRQSEKEVCSFLSSVSGHDISTSPFDSFWKLPGTAKVLQVEQTRVFPNPASKEERRTHLNRIKQKIEFKIERGQRDSTHQNILAIQAMNWTIPRLPRDSASHPFFVEAIEPTIREIFSCNTAPTLTGIVFFTHRFYGGVLFLNPHCEPDNKLNRFLRQVFEETLQFEIV